MFFNNDIIGGVDAPAGQPASLSTTPTDFELLVAPPDEVPAATTTAAPVPMEEEDQKPVLLPDIVGGGNNDAMRPPPTVQMQSPTDSMAPATVPQLLDEAAEAREPELKRGKPTPQQPPPQDEPPIIPPPQHRPSFHGGLLSTTERIVSSVPPPVAHRLPHNQLFTADMMNINLPQMQAHMMAEGRLETADALIIIKRVTSLLRAEPNLLTLTSPITICGDLHGQYYDLPRLFEVGGAPQTSQYLFLGNMVDRGNFSLEVILHLYSLKLTLPRNLWLLRGSHECRHLSEFFTLRSECLNKYSSEVYEALLESFNCLPLAAVVDSQLFCVHGGISPEILTLDDVRKIDRFHEPPSAGPMCDLLWSDPAENYAPQDSTLLFAPNPVRGCSWVYTYNAVCNFLIRNDLLSIARAHEAQDEGFLMHKTWGTADFPSVITIFSAPNFLDAYNNKGAVLQYGKAELGIKQFVASPHPYYLPNFMDVFTWSLPFVTEKTADMLLVLLKLCNDALGDEVGDEQELAKRREVARDKIQSVSRFMRMLSTLRCEQETVFQLKLLLQQPTIPRGLLLGGKLALHQALKNFKDALEADLPNRRRPPWVLPTRGTHF